MPPRFGVWDIATDVIIWSEPIEAVFPDIAPRSLATGAEFAKLIEPQRSIIQVEDYYNATSQLAQTTLRSVLGKHELDEMLAERDKLNIDIQRILDAATDVWGIKVTSVEIKHVDINETMIRAIALATMLGALVASVSLLRISPSYGLAAILWLFAVVWGADIAAYFAGRSIGGPKLWPRVSPGKTWAGAIVGALAGAFLGLALAPWTNRPLALFWLGLATAIVSELGDLFESALKRRFGVKDSSGLIPGHGGLMDRLDGFWGAVLIGVIIGLVRGGFDAPARGLLLW